MAEFESQLDRILGNPEAMAQIMRLAGSLGASGPDAPPAPGPPPSGPGPSPPPGPPPSPPPPGTPGPDSAPPGVPVPGPPPGTAMPGGMDSPLLRRLVPLLMEGKRDSDARRVLYALKPYLNPRRQEKIERALQLARLYRLGKGFLSEWEG